MGLFLKGAEHSQLWFISLSVNIDDTQNSAVDTKPFQDYVDFPQGGHSWSDLEGTHQCKIVKE